MIATIKNQRNATPKEVLDFLNSEEVLEQIAGEKGMIAKSIVFHDKTKAETWRYFVDEATDCEDSNLEIRTFQHIKREFC